MAIMNIMVCSRWDIS